MYQIILLLIIAIPAATLDQNSCVCRKPDDWQDANVCYEVFNELSRALINDRGNLYRMKQAFFYAPSADPVLMQIKYNISYGDNITEDQLPYCGNIDNTSAIIINQTEIIRGWTSRGVYYVINPQILNNMQMALPFAILRLINKGSRSTSGSPEVDTFLWDGSYELPTLLINLTITSLPCIPSEEVFNCTLEELNAYLKTYATSQDLTHSTAIHAGDIAYTLSEDRILHPLDDLTDISSYIKYYCYFGFFLLMVWGFHMLISGNMRLLESMHTKFAEHIELVIPAFGVGFLFIVSEFLTAMAYLKDFFIFIQFRLYVWLPTLYVLLHILYKIVRVCCKKCKEKSDYVKAIITSLTLIVLLFLIHIYCYALPTFLLLLVYPTKVITIVAYLITFIFAASIIFSVSMRLIIVSAVNYKAIGLFKSIMMIINGILVFLQPIFMYVIVMRFLYGLVLGEASAISAGPYTVLSLIPTAAISAAGWLVKNKVFSSIDEKEDKDKESDENEDENEDKSPTNNGEANALTLVVNEETPFNGNSREIETYGAACNN